MISAQPSECGNAHNYTVGITCSFFPLLDSLIFLHFFLHLNGFSLASQVDIFYPSEMGE